jgi:hypothetical protein
LFAYSGLRHISRCRFIYTGYWLAIWLLVLFSTPAAWAQQRPGSPATPPVRNIPADKSEPVAPAPPGAIDPGRPQVPGSLRKPAPDPTGATRGVDALVQRLDSSATGDSVQVSAKRKGQVETTVKYAAKDSIQFDVTRKVARLYNKANVDYGPMQMKAALITVDYGRNQVYADGKVDSLTKKMEGRPVFKDAEGTYTAGTIAYNFKTKKGKIGEIVTQQGEGYIHADVVKKLANNDFFGQHGYYTTCNLAHPHFYIQAAKMKVVPGKKVITGPFNLVIGDVPLPIGLPFGYFPTPLKSRGSGIIIPTFGQAQDRGYYLMNGGYYWAPNDYLGLRVTGDIYAGNAQRIGGLAGRAELQYRKRYTFDGVFAFDYTWRPLNAVLPGQGASTSPEYLQPLSSNSFWIRWSHTPVPKPGGGRFSASVQAGSTFYNAINRIDPRQRLTPSFNSSINYDKQIRNSPVSYSLKLSQNQTTQTGSQTFTLPDVAVQVARQYPYEWFGIEPRGRFYEQFSIGYGLHAQNQISNTVPANTLEGGLPLLGGAGQETTIPISLSNLGNLLRNSRNGVQHTFSISLGSYSKYHVNISPSVSYNENWYFQKLNYVPIRAAQALRVDTIPGFYRAHSYSTGVSLGTTFYGLVRFTGKNRYIDAIRHKVTPTLSYTYSPNFIGDPTYQNVVLGSGAGGAYIQDANGRYLGNRYLSRYQGALYNAPGSGRASSVSFAIQNSIEMKVRDKNDTTGTTPFKKVNLIKILDISSSYNFADSTFKLRDPHITLSTDIGSRLNIQIDGDLTLYQRDSAGLRLNRYLFEQRNFKLARLTNASLRLNYQFNPASGTSRAVVPRNVAPTNDPTLGTVGPPSYYADYIDFEIPWELSLSYTAYYTTDRRPLRPLRAGQLPLPLLSGSSLNTTGSLKLTENLKFSLTSGYDFTHAEITSPQVTFSRDLHCWQIMGTWIPTGIYRGYNFTIAAKSSLLQDLKLERNRHAANR